MKFSSLAWTTFALCCGIGGWVLRGNAVSRTQAATAGKITEVYAGITDVKDPADVAPATAASATKTPADQFGRTFEHSDPVVQMTVFLQALQGMTRENQPEFLAHWAIFLTQGRPPSGMDRLFNLRCGQVLGAQTLASRTGSAKDFKVLGSIKESMAGAMQTDPEGVRVWFEGLNDERFREGLLDGYVAGMADKDVAQALRFVGTLDPDLRQRSLTPLVAALRRIERPENLSAWIRTTAADPAFADSPVLPALFETTMRSALAVRQSIPTAAQLLEEHAGKAYVDLNKAREVATKYAQENLPDALAWANRMESSHPLNEPGTILLEAAGAATGKDIATAAEWCREYVTGSLKAKVMQKLAENADVEDPALAMRIQSWMANQ